MHLHFMPFSVLIINDKYMLWEYKFVRWSSEINDPYFSIAQIRELHL